MSEGQETVRMKYMGTINDESGVFGVMAAQGVYLKFEPECDVPVNLVSELRRRKLPVQTVRQAETRKVLRAVEDDPMAPATAPEAKNELAPTVRRNGQSPKKAASGLTAILDAKTANG